MLVEFRSVKQEPSGRRRWFEDAGLELIVWEDDGGRIDGFQLCYQTTDGERALTWRGGSGFSHAWIDAGDGTPLKNLTPVLQPGGAVPWVEITDAFRTRSASLDPAVRTLVLQRLEEKN